MRRIAIVTLLLGTACGRDHDDGLPPGTGPAVERPTVETPETIELAGRPFLVSHQRFDRAWPSGSTTMTTFEAVAVQGDGRWFSLAADTPGALSVEADRIVFGSTSFEPTGTAGQYVIAGTMVSVPQDGRTVHVFQQDQEVASLRF